VRGIDGCAKVAAIDEVLYGLRHGPLNQDLEGCDLVLRRCPTTL